MSKLDDYALGELHCPGYSWSGKRHQQSDTYYIRIVKFRFGEEVMFQPSNLFNFSTKTTYLDSH